MNVAWWHRFSAPTLGGTFSVQEPGVDRTCPGLEFTEVMQAALAPDVVGVFDDGLDSQGTCRSRALRVLISRLVSPFDARWPLVSNHRIHSRKAGSRSASWRCSSAGSSGGWCCSRQVCRLGS